MYETQHTEIEAMRAALTDRAACPDFVDVMRVTCHVLSTTTGVQRIDLSLGQSANNGAWTRSLIQQANDIAREWNLSTHVQFRAGVLRLSFMKPADRNDERLQSILRNGNTR